jgi:N-acetylneuraminic acid mutarotase
MFKRRWLALLLIALALSAIGLSQLADEEGRRQASRLEVAGEQAGLVQAAQSRPHRLRSEPNRSVPDQPSRDQATQDSPTQDQPSPDPGRWKEGAPIPVPIAEIAAGVIDGVIYTGGGFTPPGAGIGSWFGAYDTSDDAWERRADLPVAVHHPGMVAAAGKIWLAGGYTAQLNVNNASRRLDAYDPASDRWTPMADMPGRRGAHAALHLDGEAVADPGSGQASPGRIYVVGGVTEAGAQAEMWIYDIAADRWSTAPGPTPREHLGAATSGGKVYVLAGRGFGLGARSGILEVYDPATGGWTRLPDMPGACGGCSAASTADGRIHITGGETQGMTYGEHYIYDPAAGAWSEAAEMPSARHGVAAAAVGDRFYVIGGGRIAGLDYSTLVEWWEPSGTALPDLRGIAWEECHRPGLFVRVENIGQEQAGGFVVRDASGRFDQRVDGLAAGASVDLHDPLASGIRGPLLADADEEVRESDEGNNAIGVVAPGCRFFLPSLER